MVFAKLALWRRELDVSSYFPGVTQAKSALFGAAHMYVSQKSQVDVKYHPIVKMG